MSGALLPDGSASQFLNNTVVFEQPNDPMRKRLSHDEIEYSNQNLPAFIQQSPSHPIAEQLPMNRVQNSIQHVDEYLIETMKQSQTPKMGKTEQAKGGLSSELYQSPNYSEGGHEYTTHPYESGIESHSILTQPINLATNGQLKEAEADKEQSENDEGQRTAIDVDALNPLLQEQSPGRIRWLIEEMDREANMGQIDKTVNPYQTSQTTTPLNTPINPNPYILKVLQPRRNNEIQLQKHFEWGGSPGPPAGLSRMEGKIMKKSALDSTLKNKSPGMISWRLRKNHKNNNRDQKSLFEHSYHNTQLIQ